MIYNTEDSTYPCANVDYKAQKQINDLEKLAAELKKQINTIDEDLDDHISVSDQSFATLDGRVTDNETGIADNADDIIATNDRIDALGTSISTKDLDAENIKSNAFYITNPDNPDTDYLKVRFYKSIDTETSGDFLFNLTGNQIVFIDGKEDNEYAIIEYLGKDNYVFISNIEGTESLPRKFKLNDSGDLTFSFNTAIPVPQSFYCSVYVIGNDLSDTQVDPNNLGDEILKGITTHGNVSTISFDTFTIDNLKAANGDIDSLSADTISTPSLSATDVEASTIKTETLKSLSAIETDRLDVVNINRKFKSAIDINATDDTEKTYIEIPEFDGEIYLNIIKGSTTRLKARLSRMGDSKTVTIKYKKNAPGDLVRIERALEKVYLVIYGGGTLMYNYIANGIPNPFVITVYPNIPPYTDDDVVAYYETSTLEHTVIFGTETNLEGVYVVGSLGATSLDFGGDLTYDNLTISNNLAVGSSITTTDLSAANNVSTKTLSVTEDATVGFGLTVEDDITTNGKLHAVDADISGQTKTGTLVVTNPGATINGKEISTIQNIKDANGEGALAGGGAVPEHAHYTLGKNSIAYGTNAIASGAGSLAFGDGAVARNANTVAIGKDAKAEGAGSVALGNGVNATGDYSVSIGRDTKAEGKYSTALGRGKGKTTLTNISSMGQTTFSCNENLDKYTILSNADETEFYYIAKDDPSEQAAPYTYTLDRPFNGTLENGALIAQRGLSLGDYSFSQGLYSSATGEYSTAMGCSSSASGFSSNARGFHSIASGETSSAEGSWTEASGTDSHTEGNGTKASAISAHAEGTGSEATAGSAHAEGEDTKASGFGAHAEGANTRALGNQSHAEGCGEYWEVGFSSKPSPNKFVSTYALNIGDLIVDKAGHYFTITNKEGSGAPWTYTASGNFFTNIYKVSGIAFSNSSHVEGESCIAGNKDEPLDTSCAHAEGYETVASGLASHSEGFNTIASGNNSHVGGSSSESSGQNSFAHGWDCHASGQYAFALGDSATVDGYGSFAYGFGLNVPGERQVCFGRFNTEHQTDENIVFAIGNGADNEHRSDAFTVDWDGNVRAKNLLTLDTSERIPANSNLDDFVECKQGYVYCADMQSIVNLPGEIKNRNDYCIVMNIGYVDGYDRTQIVMGNNGYLGFRFWNNQGYRVWNIIKPTSVSTMSDYSAGILAE